ncbi:caspase domain-containing protein [Russula compacta]|nr:caspase domain-containing protein [Russula compacta]
MEQDNHYRHRDHHHLSHSQSHSHSRNGSPSMTPAPPLHLSRNSEPAGPDMSAPTFSYPSAEYQLPYAAQPAYGPTFTPTAAPEPMPGPSDAPTGAPRRIPSPQYPPNTGAPFGSEQTRALHASHKPGSHADKPPVSQEVDALEPKRHHPLFRRSRCTGKRKAVCVGINYVGSQNELHGCVDDARNIYQFLIGHHRYSNSDIIVLTDDNQNPRSQPTRKNLLNAMRWLVQDARADDALFFHYSGHGGRTRDLHGDKADGWDDVIFPVDFKTAGIITDDVLHETLVKSLPPGCRLTAVFDSCHSGSILDLVFEFHSNGVPKSSPVSASFQQAKSTPADVVCFSGCEDTQKSVDVVEGGVAVGAMSYAFLKVLKRNPQIAYIDLLRGVREILKKHFSQKPQLSASHVVDIHRNYIM